MEVTIYWGEIVRNRNHAVWMDYGNIIIDCWTFSTANSGCLTVRKFFEYEIIELWFWCWHVELDVV